MNAPEMRGLEFVRRNVEVKMRGSRRGGLSQDSECLSGSVASSCSIIWLQ